MNRKICVGVIMGAHGVRGEVRLRSFTDDPESIFAYKPVTDEEGKRAFTLKRKGMMKDHFIVSLKGVTDRNAAEALRGTELFVERAILPPAGKGEYYEADLVGLAAKTEDGKTLGKVLALHDYGAGTFLEIEPVKGKSFMLPFTDAFVPDVNLAKGFIQIVVPEGWLAEDKKKAKAKK
jgi:16S rRNA processing protein RimM